MIWLIGFIISWTVYSLYWFFTHLGQKFRKEEWYDFYILIPTLIIAFVVGLIFRLKDFVFGE
jgi:hypothetical protein